MRSVSLKRISAAFSADHLKADAFHREEIRPAQIGAQAGAHAIGAQRPRQNW